MKLSAAAASVIGSVRQINQDNFYLDHMTRPLEEECFFHQITSDSDVQVFSVCDGMGGEESGEEASLRAVELLNCCSAEDVANNWQQYVKDSNASVCQLCRERKIRAGTTLALLIVGNGSAKVVNIGDSRIYLIRENQIRQLSYDHTEFQMMVDAGVLTVDDFSHSSAHNHLTQHLGIRPEDLLLDPYVVDVDQLQTGDVFLLCSDGLYGVLSNQRILELIQIDNSLEETCNQLTEEAIKQGSRDNITAMLIQVEKADSAQVPNDQPMHVIEQMSYSELHNTEKQHQPTNRGLLGIAGLLCSLVLVIGGITVYYTRSNPRVPNVVSQTTKDARLQLEKHGFIVTTQEQYSETEDTGTVISQSAAEGERMPRGSAIALTVSSGQKPIELPNTIGMTESEATRLLEEKGFEVSVSRKRRDETEIGAVYEQSPNSGTLLSGSVISLTVCSGPESVDVPNVVGVKIQKAQKKLEQVGFEVEVDTDEDELGDLKKYIVLTQDPEAGSQCEYGSIITLKLKNTEKVEVPNLKGVNYQDAYRTLEELGLKPEYNWKMDSASYGTVIEQQYAPGSRIKKGSSVFYYVSASNTRVSNTQKRKQHQ